RGPSAPSRALSFAKTSSDCPTRSGASEIGGQDAEPGWRQGSAIFRPAALHGHTGFARRTGSGRQSRTCEASSVVVRTDGAELRRPADVAMMQATDFGNLHDPARVGELDGPGVRRILVEREMSASPVIAPEVAGPGVGVFRRERERDS